MSAIATYGPALSLVGLAFTKCDPTMAVVWMTLALTLDGAMCSGYNVNALDLSPNYAGSIRAFSSVVANATGFLAPTVVSFIIEGKVKYLYFENNISNLCVWYLISQFWTMRKFEC